MITEQYGFRIYRYTKSVSCNRNDSALPSVRQAFIYGLTCCAVVASDIFLLITDITTNTTITT